MKELIYYTYSYSRKKYYFDNWEYADKSFIKDFPEYKFVRAYTNVK